MKDLFNYFHKNQFFAKSKSGFLPSDSCISQSLSTVPDINYYFDCDPTIDIRGVFLDISKVFDKVWHNRTLFKSVNHTVKGKLIKNLLKLIRTPYQRVVILNGKTCTWELVKSGVPQGFVLSPLMFLINVSDLQDDISSTSNIFAEGTSFFSIFLIKTHRKIN